ncbi:hypothetical protein FA95DRAFT_1278845 [Auriscalpium vulgare]|uniref:Uncharacterized protein n=1 Tax=Auriscalpium vulgare TaxID=40419 RepID=A0ACB8RSP1_9AGAM|nr:hypothetical protein FA95DRAFT_1278845 [Auriscalpium vulgare]
MHPFHMEVTSPSPSRQLLEGPGLDTLSSQDVIYTLGPTAREFGRLFGFRKTARRNRDGLRVTSSAARRPAANRTFRTVATLEAVRHLVPSFDTAQNVGADRTHVTPDAGGAPSVSRAVITGGDASCPPSCVHVFAVLIQGHSYAYVGLITYKVVGLVAIQGLRGAFDRRFRSIGKRGAIKPGTERLGALFFPSSRVMNSTLSSIPFCLHAYSMRSA